MSEKPLLVVIVGATASGKTDLAIALAKKLGTEIVSADSRQIYREMTICTAKPTDEELAEVKHHFIGTASVEEVVSAGTYEKACIRLLDDLFIKYPVVVMVGGSGLYIDAVCKGFDDLPLAPPGTREALNEHFRLKGLSHLQEMLRIADPVYYKEVDLQNPRRIMRALELCATGTRYSEIRTGKSKERNFRSLMVRTDLPREELYRRIDERVDLMMSRGLLEEVKGLLPKKDLPALQTFGYTELFEHLLGKTTLKEAVTKIKQNTKNYAKRQVTWFRKKESYSTGIPGLLAWIESESSL